MKKIILLAAAVVLFSSVPSFAQGKDGAKLIRVNQAVSDSKFGAWSEWQYTPEDFPIKRIEVTLKREKGGQDTFVNLGFKGGQNFEPMRAYIKSDGPTTISFEARGEKAGGRTLVMKAYNGRLLLSDVKFFYDISSKPIQIEASNNNRPDYGNRPGGNRPPWGGPLGRPDTSDKVRKIVRNMQYEFSDVKTEARRSLSWPGDKKLMDKLDDFESALSKYSYEVEDGRAPVDPSSRRLSDLFDASRAVKNKIQDRGYSRDELTYRWGKVERLVEDLYDAADSNRRPMFR